MHLSSADSMGFGLWARRNLHAFGIQKKIVSTFLNFLSSLLARHLACQPLAYSYHGVCSNFFKPFRVIILMNGMTASMSGLFRRLPRNRLGLIPHRRLFFYLTTSHLYLEIGLSTRLDIQLSIL